LPGLQYDEKLFANAALGNLDGTFVAWSVSVVGREVPMMLMGYIGLGIQHPASVVEPW
jgi:hypothetical protein